MNASTEHAEELNLFSDSIRQFLNAEVSPYFDSWEKAGIMPKELWLKMGGSGFLGVDMPEQYGGVGVPHRFSAAVLHVIAAEGYGSLAGNLSVHSDIVIPYVLNNGTEEQKSHWIPKLTSGEIIGAIAMTEPGAGSDLQGMRTSAVKDGDDYIINGSKTFITNGQLAGMVIVCAKTDPSAGAKGITLFLVDTNTPGFSRGRNLEKMGLHAADTSEIFFEDMRVPASSILGEKNKGFACLMNELPRERLSIALCALGGADFAFQQTVEYVSERKAFGKSIGEFQNTRFKLAEVKTRIEVVRAYVEQCMDKLEIGQLDATAAAMVKLSSTEMQWDVTDDCLQLFGGYGYMTEYPISRALLDARVQRIYGGTSEIMKELIARSFLGR